eukprot:COSAG02_NODE_188_length_30307_cov_341.858746_23_plen_62_part_00
MSSMQEWDASFLLDGTKTQRGKRPQMQCQHLSIRYFHMQLKAAVLSSREKWEPLNQGSIWH